MTQNNQTPDIAEPLNTQQELNPHDELELTIGERLRTVDSSVRTFVKEKPLTAVAIALGAGFVLGKIITRHKGD